MLHKKNNYYDPSKSHHTTTGFCNLDQMGGPTGEEFKRWRKERKENHYPLPPKKGYEAFINQWWQEADFSQMQDAVWWLGHSTLLIQLQGLWVLTDPILTERASPIKFAGPHRRAAAAARVDQLPRVDVVLISHNHYDHLDHSTVMQLLEYFPDVLFIVPLGLKKWFKKRKARNVIELDWWESAQYKQATFVCVPAQHWSMRSLWDRNTTLWSGWVMQQPGFNFYFSGDTGYTPALQEIGNRFGPFDLAALSIGAYAPRWFMKNQHISPEEAVQLHRELNCHRSLAIHWGAFELADEALDEPLEMLAEELRKQQVSPENFLTLKMGECWSINLGVE